MTSLQKLAQLGCGNEILLSAQERGNIHAAISNGKTFFKYCKEGVKSGLFNIPDSFLYIRKYYNELLRVEHLVKKYQPLYGEDYYKLKLQIEKFYLNDNLTASI